MNDKLMGRLNVVYNALDVCAREMTALRREARIITAQLRDGQLTKQEWIVYLDGLTQWEQEHGRGIFA